MPAIEAVFAFERRMMTQVLVVDSERAYRDSINMILSREGYLVQTASHGGEALALAEDTVPDVLVIDPLLRRGMNGLDVAESLRRTNPRLQTLLVTGYPTPQLLSRVEALPATECLGKPFGLPDLVAAVQLAVERLKKDMPSNH